MLTYEYQCQECQHNFEIQQSIKDEALKQCPECGDEDGLERVIGQPYFSVKQEVTTLGQQAERNTKRMGTYEFEAKERQRLADKEAAADYAISSIPDIPGGKKINKPKKIEKPWYSDTSGKATPKKLAKLTPKQKEKYIIEGKIS